MQLTQGDKLPDGVPCKHPECLRHVTHPCEGCGHIAGRSYIAVPVSAAAEIAERFGKSMVIINAWDPTFDVLHTTTYGVTAEDKIRAADGGRIAAKALDADLLQAHVFQDFRLDVARTVLAVLKTVAIWHGAAHEDDCPQDDTCRCRFKPFNDLINKTITEAEVKVGEVDEIDWEHPAPRDDR